MYRHDASVVQLQVGCTFLVIFVSMWAQWARKPFVEHTLNDVESLSLIDCALITVAALMMLTNQLSAPRDEATGFALPTTRHITRSVSFNDESFAYVVVAIMFVAFVCIAYVVVSEVADTVPFLKLSTVSSAVSAAHVLAHVVLPR